VAFQVDQGAEGDGNQSASSMPIRGHLRELRSRLVKALLAISIGAIAGWIAYPWVFDFLSVPFDDAVSDANASGREVTLALTGVADPFVLQLQIAVIAGLVVASPIWIFQMWRFITPGLKKRERLWAITVTVSASVLFALGAGLAYLVIPTALRVLLSFTPQNVENIVSVDRYLSFFLRMVLVFGVGFLVPLFLIALNLVGLLSGRTLLTSWRWIIFLIFIFAAVATPTGDPINLLLLAGPMFVLIYSAIGLCLLNDRRRIKRNQLETESPRPSSQDAEF